MAVQVFLLVAGFVMLLKGADWFVEGASALAARLGVPQLVIGLTVVAMGTSAPEAAVSISAAIKGNGDITIGNILGSNILNVFIILGLSAAIVPLAVNRMTVRRDIPFLLGVSGLLLLQGLDGTIGMLDGGVQLLLFAIYLGRLLVRARQAPDREGSPARRRKLWQLGALIAGGMAVIVAGSSMAVDAASAIARLLGMSERFIGLTVVALGTSLPELFTSVTAARKGSADIAIGNIVGSNIFNILFVVGASSLLAPVPFEKIFLFDNLVAALSTAVLLLCCAGRGRLERWHGVALLAGYTAYFLQIV